MSKFVSNALAKCIAIGINHYPFEYKVSNTNINVITVKIWQWLRKKTVVPPFLTNTNSGNRLYD